MHDPAYETFDRRSWSALRLGTPLTLTPADLADLSGINEALSLEEVEQIYLPLSRLINLHVQGWRLTRDATAMFLGRPGVGAPFILGMAGSVAVGKSTTARVLRTVLQRWPDTPRVDLVTTDGFLLPNAELERRGILHRKGFPESYDRQALLGFVEALKSGAAEVSCPVYSHLTYDVMPGETKTIAQPDIVIVEGLNVLQTGNEGRFVSDHFDLSVYVDADTVDLKRWYVRRFRALRDSAFQDPASYFHRYAHLSDQQADDLAASIWLRTNEPNLLENILPTRERASVVLRKGPGHRVNEVRLRRH